MLKYVKYISLVLCGVIIFGFFQPAIWLGFSIAGINSRVDFSLATFFESRTDMFDAENFTRLVDDSEVLSEVAVRLGVSVGAYLLTMVCVLALVVLIARGRLPRGRLLIAGAAAALLALAGRVILSVPPLANRVLADAIADNFILRLLTLFIDIPEDIISITLGRGYWITAVALGVLLLGLLLTVVFPRKNDTAIPTRGA